MNAGGASWSAVRNTEGAATYFHAGTAGDEDELSGRSPLSKNGSVGTTRRHGPLKFFLVEDNPLIRENLAETLHEMVGAEVVGISDAQSEATLWLCDPSHEWDVAVVDIFLKRGNGVQVVAALQGHKRQQKIIVLSNYASPEVRSQCLRLGADAVFDKSTELDDLIEYCAKVQTH